MVAEILHRVVLADDHSVLRSGLKLLIERTGKYKVVGEVANGVDLINFLESHTCEIVVLDLGMPQMNGLDALPIIRNRFSQLKVIVLTTHKARSFLRKALSSGAAGYVLKEDAHETLLAAMDAGLRGQKHISRDLMNFIVNDFAPDLASPIAAELLSEREKEILQLTANGLTSREIGERLGISFRTVEVHRANIREKLNLANNSELMKFAIEHGLD